MQTDQEINSGKPNILKPRKALNKAFLRVKPNRSQIEQFKENLIQLLDRTNDTESEEFQKNLVTEFLKKTYFEPNHFNQIARLVYELDWLTEEEIEIVEDSKIERRDNC